MLYVICFQTLVSIQCLSKLIMQRKYMYQLASNEFIVMLVVILYILEKIPSIIESKQVTRIFESLHVYLITFVTTKRKSFYLLFTLAILIPVI